MCVKKVVTEFYTFARRCIPNSQHTHAHIRRKLSTSPAPKYLPLEVRIPIVTPFSRDTQSIESKPPKARVPKENEFFFLLGARRRLRVVQFFRFLVCCWCCVCSDAGFGKSSDWIQNFRLFSNWLSDWKVLWVSHLTLKSRPDT